ncbi:MAG: type I pullulanase [Bacilli bacterium]|nr:type I pullulanase [Bacilli bacterium]
MLVEASLISKTKVSCRFYSVSEVDLKHSKIEIDHFETKEITPLEITETEEYVEAIFDIEDFELGHSYFFLFSDIGRIPLNVSKATEFEGFDEEFFFDGELGAFYEKDKTTFKVWAPLASSVLVKFDDDSHSLIRGEKGVWSLIIEGDLKDKAYTYLITNNEITVETIDVYAKASTENSLRSVVLDLEELKVPKASGLPSYKSPSEAIIYEGSVRDMSIDSHSDIINKGTFLGLIEKGRKTEKGNSAGFDYYSSLGFTHLQLLPIFDFKTVDETNPSSTYNWGYDPIQYFVPEGSYSSNAKDPKARIVEAQKMIEAFHEKGIRIVSDVVFNHVYEYLSSPFEKTVPNYYFRRLDNGKMSNASWCGNDLASEKPMVRKLIVDAAKWWMDYYNVDGFRFDLMGLIDVDTIKEIQRLGLEKDPSFLVYGEGWNMAGNLATPLANMDNSSLLPKVAFFNDSFREDTKRYAGGEWFARDDFKAALLGSENKFNDLSQSINYVECHDNHTFFDYLEGKKGITGLEEKINRSKLSLALIALSLGVPFFHMGEEIAQSKFGVENSYNSGDIINKFSNTLRDKRCDMVNYFQDLLKFRKRLLSLFNGDLALLKENMKVKDIEGAAMMINIKIPNNESLYGEISIFINPADQSFSYNFETDVDLLFTSGGNAINTKTKLSNVLVPKHSMLVLAK